MHRPEREYDELELQHGDWLAAQGLPADYTIGVLNAQVELSEAQCRFALACRAADQPDGPEEVLLGGSRGGGKAQKFTARVRNHRGWTTIGALKVGSIIMNPTGVQQRVIRVHDRGVMQFYRVTFEDGATTEVCGDHLWGYKVMSHKPRTKNKASNLAASRIPDTNRPDLDWGLRYSANCNVATTQDLTLRIAKGQRIGIPLTAPIEIQNPRANKLPIEPYFLGVLLGDGSFAAKSGVSVVTQDHEIDYVTRWNFEQWGGRVRLNRGNQGKAWTLATAAPRLKKALQDLNLDGKRSWEKHIPRHYIEAPIGSRWRILQGLMDTDGYCDDRGHCSYTTTSQQLARDVQEIAWSLGFSAKITDKIPICQNSPDGPKPCRRAYTVWFRGWNQDKLATIARKRERLRKPQHYPMRRIVSIEPTTEEPARCITVSHPNGLYLTDDYIVTHNSSFVIYQLADDCVRFPGLTCLFLRKVGKRARESMRELRSTMLMGIQHRYADAKGEIVFPNGSRILTGHYERESDIDGYLGQSYDIIALEEATQISGTMYEAILTSLRSSKRHPETDMQWRPRVYATTNPGGPGTQFIKSRFVHQRVQDPSRVFIPARVDDNPFVDQDYVGRLDALTGWKHAAWRLGDWNIVQGQYFTTFAREHHCRDFAITKDHLAAWEFWLSFDYGFQHRACWTLMAQDPDGLQYCCRQQSGSGWVTARSVEALRDMLQAARVPFSHIKRIVAGHDCFAVKTSDPTAPTVEQSYRVYKIEGRPVRLQRAKIGRINGAQHLLESLGDPREGRSGTLTVHASCVRLINQLETLQHDPNNPEDVSKKLAEQADGDDEYDSLRYGLMESRRAQVKIQDLHQAL